VAGFILFRRGCQDCAPTASGKYFAEVFIANKVKT